MSWQDIILSVGNLLLAASLIPSVIGRDKPALSTSLLTGSILLTFAIVYISLSLWVSVFCISFGIALWFVLAVQKYLQRPDNKDESL